MSNKTINTIKKCSINQSNKNNGMKLMFSLSSGLSCLIHQLSLISNKNVLVP